MSKELPYGLSNQLSTEIVQQNITNSHIERKHTFKLVSDTGGKLISFTIALLNSSNVQAVESMIW